MLPVDEQTYQGLIISTHRHHIVDSAFPKIEASKLNMAGWEFQDTH